ncbi:MAG TPA: PPC domain-containing protein, partial [Verrucomicrobiae bacterium]
MASARWLILFLFAYSLLAQAAAPTLDQLYPIALQRGMTNTVTAAGKFDPWPVQVWADAPGINFRAETNNGKFTVQISSDALPGPHLVRLYNKQGVSDPRFFIVSTEANIPEQEPNDEFAKPQKLDHLPAWINGRLDKSGDVDSFSFQADAGRTLIASVRCFVLMSPVDAVLRIVDTNGVQLAFNHDGTTLDPFLVWTPKKSGTYVIQIFGFAHPPGSDVKFTGGNACVYRLHLTCEPYLRYTLPLGAQRGTNTNLKMFGWNFGSESNRTIDFDPTKFASDLYRVTLHTPGIEGEVQLPLGDAPETTEQEPNNSPAEAHELHPPASITGLIDQPGDVDYFKFSARKGDKFVFRVHSAAFGFPLDAILKIEDTTGKVVAKNDDASGPDPLLDWTAPEKGTFFASVGNVLHRGGPEYLYHLQVLNPAPDWKATVASGSFNIEPGKTNDIKLNLKRLYGFNSKLNVTGQDLPDGITLQQTVAPVSKKESSAKDNPEISLKLAAAPDAKTFSGPIKFMFKEADSGITRPVLLELAATSVNNGVPTGFNKLLMDTT